MLASPLGMMPECPGNTCLLDGPSMACSGVPEPGSPQLAEVRCHPFGRMEADVKLLSGSKRSCEGYTLLQDEAEADDTSMVSLRCCWISAVAQSSAWRTQTSGWRTLSWLQCTQQMQP